MYAVRHDNCVLLYEHNLEYSLCDASIAYSLGLLEVLYRLGALAGDHDYAASE